MIQNEHFDIILISFSDLRTDGRSRNFIDMFKSAGKSVFTISLTGKYEKKSYLGSDSVRFKVILKRYVLKWAEFLHKSFYHKYPFYRNGVKYIFAADLYSLQAAISIAKKVNKKNKNKPKIIYDSREIFSALGPLSASMNKQKIISRLEKRFVRKVDHFVVSGELDAEYLKSYFKTDTPFSVIYNYPRKKDIVRTDYLRDIFNIPKDKKIIIYQGVLLNGRGILPLLNAFRELKEKYAFCIIGSGGFEKKYRKYVKDNSLEKVVFFHPEVEYSELLNITASADIGMSIIEPISFSYELALPNKLFEYISCGLPVLVSDLPALHKVVADYDNGVIIPKTLKKEEIIEKMEELERNYKKYHKNSGKISNEFFFEKQLEEIENIIS
ncbi:MAG: hypothetical protein A2X64_04940 [Ignavibacteria bacterium GWF2_33_9]|nr:MAG: hypothetical protein A2X64_04940 [Ignavibacteria bacterium GWF2_33_9]